MYFFVSIQLLLPNVYLSYQILFVMLHFFMFIYANLRFTNYNTRHKFTLHCAFKVMKKVATKKNEMLSFGS